MGDSIRWVPLLLGLVSVVFAVGCFFVSYHLFNQHGPPKHSRLLRFYLAPALALLGLATGLFATILLRAAGIQ